MAKRTFIPLAAASLALMAVNAPLIAQDVAEAISQEERIDNGLKSYGYAAGLARGCVAEQQRQAFEKDVLDIHASIARLLGTDRAFLFSAAFGYGSSVEIEVANCPDIIAEYETRTARYRSGAEGQ
ncbi:MAG: hypothetical protein AAF650_11710 [Pseudomonadota bacterium]